MMKTTLKRTTDMAKKKTEPIPVEATDEERLAELNELFELGCAETFSALFDDLTKTRTRGGVMLTQDLRFTRDDWPRMKEQARLVYTKQSLLSNKKRAMVSEIARHVQSVAISTIAKHRPDLTRDLVKPTEVIS